MRCWGGRAPGLWGSTVASLALPSRDLPFRNKTHLLHLFTTVCRRLVHLEIHPKIGTNSPVVSLGCWIFDQFFLSAFGTSPTRPSSQIDKRNRLGRISFAFARPCWLLGSAFSHGRSVRPVCLDPFFVCRNRCPFARDIDLTPPPQLNGPPSPCTTSPPTALTPSPFPQPPSPPPQHPHSSQPSTPAPQRAAQPSAPPL